MPHHKASGSPAPPSHPLDGAASAWAIAGNAAPAPDGRRLLLPNSDTVGLSNADHELRHHSPTGRPSALLVSPTLPAPPGVADGGNGVTLARLAAHLESSGFATTYATPQDLATAHAGGGCSLATWLAGLAPAPTVPPPPDLLLVLHAFKCGAVLDAAEEAAMMRPHGSPPVPVVLVLGGTDVNVDAGANGSTSAAALARRAAAASRVVAFSETMLQAAPPGSLPPPPQTVIIPQGVLLPTPAPADDTSAASHCLHAALGVSASTPVLLLPAGLRPIKDVLWAAAALCFAAEEIRQGPDDPPPFVLAVCGPELDAHYAAEVRVRVEYSVT